MESRRGRKRKDNGSRKGEKLIKGVGTQKYIYPRCRGGNQISGVFR